LFKENDPYNTERAIIIKKTVMKKIKISDLEREKNIPIPIKTKIDPRTIDFCRRSWLNHNTFSFAVFIDEYFPAIKTINLFSE